MGSRGGTNELGVLINKVEAGLKQSKKGTIVGHEKVLKKTEKEIAILTVFYSTKSLDETKLPTE